MKAHEVLSMVKPLIEKLSDIGLSPNDCRYIEAYAEYQEMKKTGDKTEWILGELSERYKTTKRSLYTAFKKLSQEV